MWIMEKSINNPKHNLTLRKFLAFSVLAILFSLKGIAQTDTEYWFAAPEVDSTHADSSILRIVASSNPVIVTVSIPANPAFAPIIFNLPANTDTLIDWNRIGLGKVDYKNSIENTAYDRAVNKGIHIFATDKIEAYYEVKTLPNSEVFALKGANALGTHFYAIFQNYWYNKFPLACNGDNTQQFGTLDSLPLWGSENQYANPASYSAINDFQDQVGEFSWSAFDIVATEDGTTIDITPTNAIVSNTNTFNQYGFITGGAVHSAGVKYTITLNAGQTYSARQAWKTPKKSIGGTNIQVTNPTGHNIALTCKEDGLVAWNHDNAPIYLQPTDNTQTNLYDFNNYGIDLIGDQMIPVNLIGNDYVVMRGNVYPDEIPTNTSINGDWDWDGEKVFLTATAPNTVFSIQAYNNAGTAVGGITTSPTLNAGQVYAYEFKYNSNKANIEQFLRITSSTNGTGPNFYTYHVSGQLTELGSAIIPTIMGCTGSTQLAFTRSYNGLFQVNLMVKQGAEGSFKVFDSKGADQSYRFKISAANFVPIPGSGWSVYTQPNNNWTDTTIAAIGETYIIKNTLNVFHLGIINISQFISLDTTRTPQYIGNWYNPPSGTIFIKLDSLGGYPTTGTIPSSVIATIWKQPGWTYKKLEVVSGSNMYMVTNNTSGKSVFVAHWISNNRGAFYGYFSDFNKFSPFAAVPDANHPKCLGDTIQLKAAGGVTYTWSQPANLKFIDPASAQNPRVVPQVTGSYTLNVHIVGFCSKDTTYTFVFKVVSPPKPTISGPSNVCIGSGNQTYSVALADTNGFATSIKTWTVVGGTIVSGQGTKSVVVNWTASGSQSVSVTVDNQSCAAGSATSTVTISTLPTISITNPAAVCPGTVVPQLALTSFSTGATFQWSSSNPNVGLPLSGTLNYIPSFTATNGGSTSISSTISVTPTSTLGCVGIPGTYLITVDPKDNATFTYPATQFCQNAANSIATPTISGLAGGSFSSTTGLVFVSAATGEINLAATTAGTYLITYTTNGACPNTSSTNITINAASTAGFLYGGPYCKENSNPSPTLNTGAISGTFSATPAGLAFVSTTTGQINLASSTAGTYIVTNLIAAIGGCNAVSATATVTINATPSVTVATSAAYCNGLLVPPYTFTSTPTGASFVWSSSNSLAVGLSKTGDNTANVPGFTATNAGTTVISTLITATPTLLGCVGSPKTYTISVTPNDNAGFQYQTNSICKTAVNPIPTITGLAGGVFSSTTANIKFVSTTTGQIDLAASTISLNDTIKYTTNGTCPTTSFNVIQIATAPSAAFAYAGPYCKDASNPNPKYNTGGGPGTFTATPVGLVFVSATTGQVNLAASTPGKYLVTNTIAAASGCAAASDTASIVINPPITVAKPTLSAYCPGSIVPEYDFVSTPSGANYLWSNSNTTAGLSVSGNTTSYIPTFTATNGTLVNVFTTISVTPTLNGCTGTPNSYTITVTAKDNAGFNYSATSFCQTGTNPIPTITGLTGGTFSAPAGIVFVSTTTGEINLASSIVSALPYTITYTTKGVCPNTATAAIYITSGNSAAFAYAGPYCKENTNPLPTLNAGALAGVFTASPAGLVINATTGQVDLTASAVGSYKVTNTVAAINGCGQAIATDSITIKPTPTVTVPNLSPFCPGKLVNGYTFVSNVAGTITWQNDNGLIGMNTNPNTNAYSTFTATNTSNGQIFGTITVTPPSNGCNGITNKFTITINPAPKVSDMTVKVCELATKNITVHSTGGAKPLASGIWTNISGSSLSSNFAVDSVLTVTAKSGTGSSQFRYILPDNNGCTDTAIVTVTNSLNPTVSLAAASVCQNLPLTLTATITGSNNPIPVWTSNPVSPGLIPANQINNTTVTAVTTNAINYFVQVVVTDSIGCSATVSNVPVDIYPKPQAAVYPASNVHICQNAPLVLTGQTIPNVVTYKWSGDLASINPNAQTTTFNSSILGNHDFDFIVISDHSCTDTLPFRVIVDANPVFSMGPDLSACSGITTKLNINPTGGSGSYIYDWSDDSGPFNLPHDNAPSYVKTNPGKYNIYLKVTDSVTKCSSSDAMVITINQNPVVNPKPNQVCSGSSVQMDGNPSLGSGVWASHLWSGADYLSLSDVTKQTPFFQSSAPGPHYLHYKVTDSNGCTGELDATVTVTDLPKPVVSGNVAVCVNNTLQLTVSNVGTSYVWTGNGSQYLDNASLQNPKFTATVANTYTLTVTSTDGNNCSGSTVLTVLVNPLPTLVAKNDSVCAGDSKQLVENNSFNSYRWTGDVSILAPTDLNVWNPKIVTTTSTTAKTYNLMYEVTDGNRCTSSVPVTVKVNALPAASITVASTGFADGDVVQLHGQPSGNYSYAWSPVDSLQSSVIQNPLTIPLRGTTTFMLTVTDNLYKCSNTASIKLIDTTGHLLITIKPTPAEICIGDTSNIEVNPTGGRSPYIYTWSSVVENRYADGSARVRPTITTTYSITVIDANGTEASATTSVIVNQLPSVSLTDLKVCANDTLQIAPTVTVQNGTTISTYQWTGSGASGLHGGTAAKDVTFYNSTPGTYPLILSVVDSNTCKNSASMTVTIDTLPVIAIQASKPEICAGSSVALSVNQTAGAAISNYAWTDIPSGHLSAAIGSTNSYSSTVSGDVYVSVVDGNGCKATANYHVTVDANPIALVADASVCQNAVLQLDGKPSGGSGTYINHLWSGVDSLKVSPRNSQQTTFNTAISGSYSLIYSVTDSKNCSGSTPIQVVVNALPSVTYSPQPLQVCSGSPLTITADPEPSALIISNIWSESGKSLIGSSTQIIFQSDSVGVKKIYYEVKTQYCTLYDTVSITLLPKPTITINPDKLQVCENELDNLGSTYAGGTMTPRTNNPYNWTTNPNSIDYLSSYTSANTVFKKAQFGTVEVSLEYFDQNGCFDIDTVTIQVNQLPQIPPIAHTIHACQGQTENLDINPNHIANRTFAWTGGTGLGYLSSKTISNPDFTSSVTGSFTLNYTITETGHSCSINDSITVNVTSTPLIDNFKTEICQGDPKTLDISGMNATAYVWAGSSNDLSLLSSRIIANPTISTANSGNYSFTVTGTDGTAPNSCSETSTVSVKVYATPTISNVPIKDTAYYKEPYQFNPKVFPLIYGYTYSWTPSASFIDATVQNAQTIPLTSNLYGITFLVTETTTDLGCKASKTSQLIVRDRMHTDFNPDTVCKGQDVLLTGTTTGGSPDKIYTWTTTDGKTHTGTTFPFTSTDTTVVTLTVMDKYDTVTVSKQSIVYPNPPTQHISDTTCAGYDVTLNIKGDKTDSTKWYGDGSQNLTSTNTQTTTFKTSTSDSTQLYTLYEQTTNKYGCKVTDTVNIKVNQNPKVKVSDSVHVVYGKPTIIDLGSNNNYSYQWTPADLFIDPTSPVGTTTTITKDTVVYVKITDKTTGCVTTDTIHIKGDSAITVVITPKPLCKGGEVTITATTNHVFPNATPMYIWKIGTTVVQSSTSPVYTYTPTETSTVTVFVTDGVSSATDIKTQTVYLDPHILNFSPDLQTYVIGQGGRTITANVVSGTGAETFNWSVNAGADVTPKNEASTLFDASVPGNYTVTVTVFDSKGCGDTATLSPTVINAPRWVDVCSGASYLFDLGSPNDLKWVITGAKDTTFTGNKAQLPFNTAGKVSISLYDLSDLTMAHPVYSKDINVNTKPYVDFIYTPDTGISIGEDVSFINRSIIDANGKVIPNNMTFFWDFIGDEVYTSLTVNSIYSYEEIGKYAVSLIGMDTITHCRDTVVRRLEVTPNPLCNLKFPNAFTPDAPKDNHFLPGYIVGIKDSGYDLQIFNRWGQLLFETNSKSGKWDGTYKGEVCKQDVYVYHCKAVCENGKDLFINGDVTLIK